MVVVNRYEVRPVKIRLGRGGGHGRTKTIGKARYVHIDNTPLF